MLQNWRRWLGYLRLPGFMIFLYRSNMSLPLNTGPGVPELEIQYGIHSSPFGNCFLAQTERGVCALEFLDGDLQAVIQRFRQKWQHAVIFEDMAGTKQTLDHIFGSEKIVVKALLFGTNFQLKVWEALLAIPYGHLTSYDAVAKVIGNPKANRAVGSAIGQNAIAYLIPCHRVIRQMGALGGYKWDLAGNCP